MAESILLQDPADPKNFEWQQGTNRAAHVVLVNAAGAPIYTIPMSGTVAIDQTTPGTTNLVQVGGTLPAFAATPAVTVSGSNVTETTHHNAATVAADGTDANVSGLSTVALHITGTSTSRTVRFYGSVNGTNFVTILGVNFATASSATSTTGTDEQWQFDVRGLKKFRADLEAVAGGNVTAVSNAEA